MNYYICGDISNSRSRVEYRLRDPMESEDMVLTSSSDSIILINLRDKNMNSTNSANRTDYGNNYKSAAPLGKRVNLHTDYSTNPIGWHQWMANELNLTKASRVVELGCGTGDLWSRVDSDVLSEISLCLTDSSQAMLDTCKEKHGDLKNISFLPFDLDSKFEIPEETNLLVANHCIYHSSNPKSTLERIKSQLCSGTRCIFATNSLNSMIELSRFLPKRYEDGIMRHLIANFTLESEPLVEEVFGNAAIKRYDDALNVTNVEPLLSYVTSLPLELTENEVYLCEQMMMEVMVSDGKILISKDTGYISAIVE